MVTLSRSTRHPLSPLDGGEISLAPKIVPERGEVTIPVEDICFAYTGLCDPPEAFVHVYDRGEEVTVDDGD
jgi:hypothetical protein